MADVNIETVQIVWSDDSDDLWRVLEVHQLTSKKHEPLGSSLPWMPDRMLLHLSCLLVLFQGKMRVTQDSISLLIYEADPDDPDDTSILHIPIDQVACLIQARASMHARFPLQCAVPLF